MAEEIIDLNGINPVEFFGTKNSKLKVIKKTFPDITIVARGNTIKLRGEDDEVFLAKSRIRLLLDYFKKFGSISESMAQALAANPEGIEEIIISHSDDILVAGPGGSNIKPKTPNQRKLVELSEKNDIVFALGPAGTGKTYTAVALAVRALKRKSVKRIILTRPAVEAGEKLGFLPGDIKEKVDPYLRPLYDALDDMLPPEKINYNIENRVIEIAPLAFMRGRTLDKAFIILDEAQNATYPQLKMFLTRLGPTAKCIITGDLSQVDLPHNQKSGLLTSVELLKDIEGIGTLFLSSKDVIRHRLVAKIIDAFSESEEKEKMEEKQKAPDNKEA